MSGSQSQLLVEQRTQSLGCLLCFVRVTCCKFTLFHPVSQLSLTLVSSFAGPDAVIGSYTNADAVVLRKRFLVPELFLESLCSFTSTAFPVTLRHGKSERPEMLSAIQAHASLWRTCYTQRANGARPGHTLGECGHFLSLA